VAARIYPLILSGGSGSRLWPLSRESRPKQFLSLAHDHSMIGATAQRVNDAARFHPPVVISNVDQRFLVMDALEHAGCKPAAVLLEPCGRNTAAAIAAGALYLAEQDPHSLVLVMASDHAVKDEAGFLRAIAHATAAVEQGNIVTFGAVAARPDTGYGYIQKGAAIGDDGVFRIARFCEKPDAKTAQAYVDAKNYFWNMGIFFFKAQALIEEMQTLCPDILAGAKRSLEEAVEDLGFLRLDPDMFAALPSLPFDIAVMEKTSKGAVLPVDIGWSDVGSWHSLWEVMPKDAEGNASREDAKFFGSRDCLAWSTPGMFTAVVGLENVAVITTDDAVLVLDKNRAEDVRSVVNYLKSESRGEHLSATQVFRPWGNYRIIDAGEGYRVKRLEVKPGASLSLQFHNHRSEHWTVVEGIATITRGEENFELKANASTYIAKGTPHRLENRQEEPLILIEVQSGKQIDENDIIRLEDNYGRIKKIP
jgi:mannose-1-phosphate guanylyltransferase/mannose-6-phosphate isomerase